MSLDSLPVELLPLITAPLGREELKELRLTSRELSTVATEQLFGEIHISPNSYSFDRANEIATKEHLSRHVRSLIYHFGVLGDVYPGFDAFKSEYFAVRKPGESRDPPEITPEVLWCYNCWLEEIDAQRTFEIRDENEELKSLCDKLPNLQGVATLLDDVESLTNPQDYIGKRTGMFTAEDTGDGRFAKLFFAVANKPLVTLSGRSIQWMDLAYIQDYLWVMSPKIKSCLMQLKTLELGLYNALNEFDLVEHMLTDAHPCSDLDKVLSHVPNLTTLKLDFEELPFEGHADKMLPIAETIFKHTWPALRTLKLEAICTFDYALVDFLRAHRDTLRHLCIGDIELVKTATNPTSPSILRLFQSIREATNLESCRITGNFINRHDQAWYVNTEYKQPECLRDQLERYICSSSRHHNDDVAEPTESQLKVFMQSGERVDMWIHKLSGDYVSFCDDSWQWCEELLSLE